MYFVFFTFMCDIDVFCFFLHSCVISMYFVLFTFMCDIDVFCFVYIHV